MCLNLSNDFMVLYRWRFWVRQAPVFYGENFYTNLWFVSTTPACHLLMIFWACEFVWTSLSERLIFLSQIKQIATSWLLRSLDGCLLFPEFHSWDVGKLFGKSVATWHFHLLWHLKLGICAHGGPPMFQECLDWCFLQWEKFGSLPGFSTNSRVVNLRMDRKLAYRLDMCSHGPMFADWIWSQNCNNEFRKNFASDNLYWTTTSQNSVFSS